MYGLYRSAGRRERLRFLSGSFVLSMFLCAAAIFVRVSAAEEFPDPVAAPAPAPVSEVKKIGPGDVNTTVELDGGKAVVTSFSELGIVDLITVSYPPADGTDNGTVEHVLVNGTPAAIPVEKTAIAIINIKDDPKYSRFVNVNPRIALSMTGVEFEKVQTVEADTLRYLFLFILKDGCNECDAAGYARIAFDFGKDGKFTKAVLVKLMKTRQPL
ncbi:MAG: hypothetical protein HQK99_00815 [Nitrospirae bacterium]|nr:hypothetical protein [Nitrospirota bacterium]